MACSSVSQCRTVFLGAEVSVEHSGTSADMSGQFVTGAEVSYRHFGTSAEMYWIQSVLGPKCLDADKSLLRCQYVYLYTGCCLCSIWLAACHCEF